MASNENNLANKMREGADPSDVSLDSKVSDGKEAIDYTPADLHVDVATSNAEDAEAQERADAMRVRLGVVEQPANPFEALAVFENLESKNPDVALAEGDEVEGLSEAASDRADEAEETAKGHIASATAENFQNAPEGPSKAKAKKAK